MDYSCSAYELKCNECGKRFGNQPLSACDDCLAPLEVHYDLEAVRGDFTREKIAAGPLNIWRYKALLPIPAGFEPDLPVGFTPLVKAKRLGKRLVRAISTSKNDAVCFPTLSFKDRVVSVALANAQAFGFETVGCSSTGNLANSLRRRPRGWASSPASLSLLTWSRRRSSTRWCTALAWSASTEITITSIDSPHSLPTTTTGASSTSIFARTTRRDRRRSAMRLPNSLAGNCRTTSSVRWLVGRSFARSVRRSNELIALGLVEDKPVRFFGAQATGCSPISTAVKQGTDYIEPQRPNTIARSLAIGNPADGPAAAKMIASTDGWAEDVSDVEIVSGIQELAETEGIFTETAGGVTTAVAAPPLCRRPHL